MVDGWADPGPGRPTVPGVDEVDLWLVDLDGPAGPAGEGSLSAGERERAARFRSAEDGRRWTAARWALRGILGATVGVAPAELDVVAGPGGKPALAGATAGTVRFNLSHSGDLALVAVAVHREVGVDVELVRSGLDEPALARLAFGEDAAAALAALGPDDRRSEFFRRWVRHEAAVKCRGTGLGAGPVDLTDLEVREVVVDEDEDERYVGAVALVVPGPGRPPVTVRRWAWSGG